MASPAKLNLLSYYANFIIMALVGLVANPMLLGLLGPSSFGIWKAAQRFYDVATSADGGAGQALKWVVAHRSGTADDDSNRRDVGAALLVWLVWLPVMVVITVIVTLTLPYTINDITAEEVPVAQMAGVILSLNVVLVGLFSTPTSVLIGSNKAYLAIGMSTAVLVLSNIGMVIAAQLGLGITGVAAVALASSVLTGVITLIVVRRSVQWWGVAKPSREHLGHMAGHSGWVLGWTYVTRILLSNELILLSVLVGAVAVAHYSFTAYVYQFAIGACLLSTSAFMPQLGRAIGKGSTAEAAGIARRVREVTLALATVAACGSILLNRDFVSLWVGGSSYLGDAANAALAVSFVQLALIRCDAQILDAGLAVRRRAVIGIAGTALGLMLGAAGYLLTRDVALMLLAMVAGRLLCSLLFPVEVRRLVPGTGIGIRPYLMSLVCIGACVLITMQIPALGWLATIGLGAVSAAALGAIAYLFILSPQSRSDLALLRRRTT